MHRAHMNIRLLSTTFLLASLAASATMASESEPPMPLVYPLEELEPCEIFRRINATREVR